LSPAVHRIGDPIYAAVLFDLDGTLYDRDALVESIAGIQYDSHRGAVPEMSRETFVRLIIEMDDHGMADKLAGYRALAAEWGRPTELGDGLLEHFWALYDRQLQAPEDTHETLKALRAAGVRLGLITNGGATRQLKKLELMGLTDAFDAVLVSESEGVRKPEREIFDRALLRLGVGPAAAVFVGDNPEADVAGALGAGLAAIWKYTPYGTPPATSVPTVRRLTDVLRHCFR
jgi:putative hydrolase of the HAD superfamily